MAKINGTLLGVYIDGTLVGSSKSCSLNIDVDLPDATTKDSGGWAEHINGLRSWDGSCEGLADPTDTYNLEQLFDEIDGRTEVTIKLSTEVTGDTYYEGTASVSNLTFDAEAEQPVGLSFSFKGNGALAKAVVV